MTTRPIVGEYLRRALQQATFAEDEGTWTARVPGFTGVFGYGETEVDALRDLLDGLEDWMKYRLQHGRDVPVLGDIDFGNAETRKLIAYS